MEVTDIMDEAFDWKRRDRLLGRLDRIVQTGRMTEAEANRIRSARSADEFNAVARDIRVRHAKADLDRAVEAGTLARADADAILEQVALGEHRASLRAKSAAWRAAREGEIGVARTPTDD